VGQLVYLQKVSANAGLSDEELEHRAFQEFGVPVHGLSRRDASKLATLLRCGPHPNPSPIAMGEGLATASGAVRQLHPVPAAGRAQSR
jgi:hypothetical protein